MNRFLKNSGIYLISSKLFPNRMYIGSSQNLHKRITRHKNSLVTGTHRSIKLKRHFNKYGIEDLTFEIIEFCEIERLLIVEQLYLDILDPYFNTCKTAGNMKGFKFSEESKIKMRNSKMGKPSPMIGKIPWNKGLKYSLKKEVQNG